LRSKYSPMFMPGPFEALGLMLWHGPRRGQAGFDAFTRRHVECSNTENTGLP
jgi:hypothetical protein